jgi:hypothetical protein
MFLKSGKEMVAHDAIDMLAMFFARDICKEKGPHATSDCVECEPDWNKWMNGACVAADVPVMQSVRSVVNIIVQRWLFGNTPLPRAITYSQHIYDAVAVSHTIQSSSNMMIANNDVSTSVCCVCY